MNVKKLFQLLELTVERKSAVCLLDIGVFGSTLRAGYHQVENVAFSHSSLSFGIDRTLPDCGED